MILVQVWFWFWFWKNTKNHSSTSSNTYSKHNSNKKGHTQIMRYLYTHLFYYYFHIFEPWWSNAQNVTKCCEMQKHPCCKDLFMYKFPTFLVKCSLDIKQQSFVTIVDKMQLGYQVLVFFIDNFLFYLRLNYLVQPVSPNMGYDFCKGQTESNNLVKMKVN